MKNGFINLLKSITNLLKIKSIITLVCSGVFIYLSITGQLPIDTITMIIVMVFTYYFNKDNKDIKISEDNKKESEEAKG